jgi:hypothetical protein
MAAVPSAPPIVHEVLRSSGQPLDAATRSLMESRLGHDFGAVRIHTDTLAAESSRAVEALAYTVGSDIAFAAGQYTPRTVRGRQLIAHELTHVIQQRGQGSPSSAERLTVEASNSDGEKQAQTIGAAAARGGTVATEVSLARSVFRAPAHIVARADPRAVALTMRLGRTIGTGIQFWPTNVTDTQVGPVSVSGGLSGGGVSRLHVIIGENLTLRSLARQILPLWTTATPFTPSGAVAPLPLDIISDEELARGLLVYNQTYLPIPGMTNWRAGFRFPLPVEIDEVTGVATLHPLQIRQLAGAFNVAWTPLLDLRARDTGVPPAAAVAANVAAFLARETTALARGIHLGARALTNAVAELPFIRETFRQLGAASFDAALAFMDNLVNREVSLLAAQRDGTAILGEIRTVLAAAPATPTAAQQASLDRANLMLGLVAGVAAVAPARATRARAEKTVTIDSVKLDGSTHNLATDVAVANGIFAQCNVRLAHGVNATATNAETTGWLGGNTDLRTVPACGAATTEERRLFRGATARFGLTARIRAFFPATFSGQGGRGYSVNPACATGPAAVIRNMAVVRNTGTTRTLAHEIGHILLDSAAHTGGTTNLMVPTAVAPLAERITDTQCTTIYGNA